jgi:transposase-like protein
MQVNPPASVPAVGGDNKTRKEVARTAGVSEHRVKQLDAVRRYAPELVESMREFGWLSSDPVRDERGVLLVGHRRVAAAELAGVEPIIQTVKLGRGDAATAERLRLAIGTNLGVKPLSKRDRERIVRDLKLEGWSIPAIAKLLRVTERTIRSDLSSSGKISGGKVKVTADVLAKMVEMEAQGLTLAKIASQLGFRSANTPSKYLRAHREAQASKPTSSPSTPVPVPVSEQVDPPPATTEAGQVEEAMEKPEVRAAVVSRRRDNRNLSTTPTSLRGQVHRTRKAKAEHHAPRRQEQGAW